MEHYDVIIIGGGMSGLAAGIRLAMFDRRVLILERHTKLGGLNSYYTRYPIQYDVGLHAVTNYVPAGARGKPLTKLLKQLRLRHADFGLAPQLRSQVAFPDVRLDFTNDFSVLDAAIREHFSDQRAAYNELLRRMDAFDPFDLDAPRATTRETLRELFGESPLVDMLLCPIMYYGSAMEDDIDFGQFVVMFNSLYREGFARPFDGVRHLIDLLKATYLERGGELKMRANVERLDVDANQRVTRVVLTNGTTFTADQVYSSAGLVETERLRSDRAPDAMAEHIGRLGFIEAIAVLDCQPRALGIDTTIIFSNRTERFRFRRPTELVDYDSAVICVPNNYDYGGRDLERGFVRVTMQANYEKWAALDRDAYVREKDLAMNAMFAEAARWIPDFRDHIVTTDTFTPTTVVKYTRHLDGAIYGSPTKIATGRTDLDNLFIIGTDQGFLGIIGAMLSGISMANLHTLQQPAG